MSDPKFDRPLTLPRRGLDKILGPAWSISGPWPHRDLHSETSSGEPEAEPQHQTDRTVANIIKLFTAVIYATIGVFRYGLTEVTPIAM
jgi:hypothetical protein